MKIAAETSPHHFLAFDLGAESGRAILGKLEGGIVTTRELSRFSNGPIKVLGHLHWNIYHLFEEMKKGLQACSQDPLIRLESLAVDTWGVDFGLLAKDGSILGLPFAYRDDRTKGAIEGFTELVPRERIYELTGIQFLPFNSLFQLFSMAKDKSSLLERTADILFMPDLFTYLLTGEKATEFTIASTSQLLNPATGLWSTEIFEALGISPGLMQDVLSPGTVVGSLTCDVSAETGLQDTLVIATASHDTAAAIAALPATGPNWAYISSGTWSLMGLETLRPIITKEALSSNFTNEGGVCGTIRFLKNITGLWLLQRCRKEWSRGGSLDYEELTRLAEEAAPFKAFVDPDWADFLNPASMIQAIQRFCEKTRQKPPLLPGEYVRCILESLALKYRVTLDELRRFSSYPIEKIHLIGGGVRNHLLCQLTADASGLPVVAGPAEATAMGNILVQTLALGYVQSLDEIRTIIKNSVKLETYEPRSGKEWKDAYERFRSLLAS